VRALFDRAIAGRREAATHAAELVALAGRLGMHLDLWVIQNALWQVVRDGSWVHDGETLARLAHALWFDEGVVLGRAGENRTRALA
jgi:hypothetical protein